MGVAIFFYEENISGHAWLVFWTNHIFPINESKLNGSWHYWDLVFGMKSENTRPIQNLARIKHEEHRF